MALALPRLRLARTRRSGPPGCLCTPGLLSAATLTQPVACAVVQTVNLTQGKTIEGRPGQQSSGPQNYQASVDAEGSAQLEPDGGAMLIGVCCP